MRKEDNMIEDNMTEDYTIEDNMILQNTSVVEVFIDTKPRGADIFIDDMLMVDDLCRVIKTPIIMTDVPKGLRKFTFKLSGYYNETVIVDIVEGSSNTVFGILFPKILM